MRTMIVIPVRPVTEGKSRLADHLSAAEREALNTRFFLHVLNVALASGQPCLVVSRSDALIREAARQGARTLLESGQGGLNGAVAEAARQAMSEGMDAILTLHCDLPHLSTEDVAAMLAAGRDADLVIAPDRSGSGTNALLIRPPKLIRTAFGPGSFAAHLALAAEAECSVTIVRRPGLAHDVDTPEDLAALEAFSRAP